MASARLSAAKFTAYDRANPQVWVLFRKYALQAAKRRRRFSGWAVVNRIRWHINIETNDPDGFKLNNNWTAFYVRKFQGEFPQYAKLFSTRKSAADGGLQ